MTAGLTGQWVSAAQGRAQIFWLPWGAQTSPKSQSRSEAQVVEQKTRDLRSEVKGR